MPAFAIPFAAGSFSPGATPTTEANGIALGVRGRDLTLDPLTGDLLVSEGDLQMVRDLAAIRQEVSIRLQFLLGEWFLDTTQGVPYLQAVLVKVPNMAAIRTVLRDAILDCVGVDSITKLDLEFDTTARKLTATWSATTNTGAISGAVGI